jgi:hypothetical protein
MRWSIFVSFIPLVCFSISPHLIWFNSLFKNLWNLHCCSWIRRSLIYSKSAFEGRDMTNSKILEHKRMKRVCCEWWYILLHICPYVYPLHKIAWSIYDYQVGRLVCSSHYCLVSPCLLNVFLLFFHKTRVWFNLSFKTLYTFRV